SEMFGETMTTHPRLFLMSCVIFGGLLFAFAGLLFLRTYERLPQKTSSVASKTLPTEPTHATNPVALKGSVEILRAPGVNSTNSRLYESETRGEQNRALSLGVKPLRILIEPPNITVGQADLPKEVMLGTDPITVKQFTDDGLVIDERYSVGVKFRITVL